MSLRERIASSVLLIVSFLKYSNDSKIIRACVCMCVRVCVCTCVFVYIYISYEILDCMIDMTFLVSRGYKYIDGLKSDGKQINY